VQKRLYKARDKRLKPFLIGYIIGLLTLCFLLSASGLAQEADNHEYKTSTIEVRSELKNILQDPRFAPQRTWAQWLEIQLDDWDLQIRDIPNVPIGTFWANVLYWIFIGWCVLTLIAILLHVLWTLGIWPKPRHEAKSTKSSHAQDPNETWYQSAYDQLLHLMESCEQQERYEEALHVQRIALLKKCEEHKAVRFHPSKTNGEYRREFPAENPHQPRFQQFLIGFDRYIYGAVNVDLKAYESMKSLFQDMTQDEPARSAH